MISAFKLIKKGIKKIFKFSNKIETFILNIISLIKPYKLFSCK